MVDENKKSKESLNINQKNNKQEANIRRTRRVRVSNTLEGNIQKFIRPTDENKKQEQNEENDFAKELARFEENLHVKEQIKEDKNESNEDDDKEVSEILEKSKNSEKIQRVDYLNDKTYFVNNRGEKITLKEIRQKYEALIESLSEENEDGFLFYKIDSRKKTWWEKQKEKYAKTKIAKILKQIPLQHKITGFSLATLLMCIILFIVYYMSPLSYVKTVDVKGNYIVSKQDLIQASGIKPKSRFWSDYFHQTEVKDKIQKEYPSVKNMTMNISMFNHITLNIEEYKVAGFLFADDKYYPVLENGTILQMNYPNNDQKRLIFTNFNSESKLKEVIAQYNKLSTKVQKAIKEIEYHPTKENDMEMILHMKDGNKVVISGYRFDNMKYYYQVKKQMTGTGVIDMEVGIFVKEMQSSSNIYNNYLNAEEKTQNSAQEIVIPEN